MRRVALLLVLTACGVDAIAEPPPPTTTAEPDAGSVDTVQVGDPIDAGVDAAPDADAGDVPDAAPDADVDAGIPPSPPPTLTAGAADRFLLRGTIVTPDDALDGEVLVEGTTITCVEPAQGCAAMPGAAGATIIETNGVIAPGLIDTHNHILFDVFDDDDWLPAQVYTNHDQWPAEPRYAAMLDTKQCLANDSQGKPAWCATTPYGTAAGSLRCEMDKWGELKGLVAGTTSIVGLAGTTSGCFASLARSIDALQNDLGADRIQTSAIFPPSTASADGVCANFTALKTDAYVIHVGEGTNAAARDEFGILGTVTTTDGCLYAPQTVITHGTAFTSTEFAVMGAAGMKLTWSPRSNVALYGATTDIPAALDANVVVSLAPDWSMGGSQNLLSELRFASDWDDAHFGDRLGAKDLVAMTTKNPATALALGTKIGRVAVGYLADLMVVTRTTQDPFASIVAARPKDVRLTMVGGRALYGDAALKAAGPVLPGCEDLDVCNTPKFVCVAETSTTNKLDQTFVQIKAALETALTDADTVSPDGYDFAPLAPLATCN